MLLSLESSPRFLQLLEVHPKRLVAVVIITPG